MERPQVASLRFVLAQYDSWLVLVEASDCNYAKKSVNIFSTLAGKCTPAPPLYLVSQVRSAAVHSTFYEKEGARASC